MRKIALAFAVSLVALGAQAQEATVGKITSVKGNVTVSSADRVVKASHGTPLTASSTILVANGASATVVLDQGCVIPLQANQHLILNPKFTCSQQLASVTQLAVPYRLAQAPVGSAPTTGGGLTVGAGVGTSLAVAGGIIAVGAVAITQTDSDPVSIR